MTDILAQLWNMVSAWPMDHPVWAFIAGYLGVRFVPILWYLVFLLRAAYDGCFDDTEMGEIVWRLAALVSGFWPNVSKKFIEKYAPAHWERVIIEGKEVDFKLIAVPKDRVMQVYMLLGNSTTPEATS